MWTNILTQYICYSNMFGGHFMTCIWSYVTFMFTNVIGEARRTIWHIFCAIWTGISNLTPMWPLPHNSTKLIQKYVKLYIFVISKQRATIWYTTRPCWLILKVFPYVNFDLLFLKMLNCYDFASFGFEMRTS